MAPLAGDTSVVDLRASILYVAGKTQSCTGRRMTLRDGSIVLCWALAGRLKTSAIMKIKVNSTSASSVGGKMEAHPGTKFEASAQDVQELTMRNPVRMSRSLSVGTSQQCPNSFEENQP
ncbi:uncharacterized protein ACNLHF_023278 [Anomaloglossus baeobatrachus]